MTDHVIITSSFLPTDSLHLAIELDCDNDLEVVVVDDTSRSYVYLSRCEVTELRDHLNVVLDEVADDSTETEPVTEVVFLRGLISSIVDAAKAAA